MLDLIYHQPNRLFKLPTRPDVNIDLLRRSGHPAILQVETRARGEQKVPVNVISGLQVKYETGGGGGFVNGQVKVCTFVLPARTTPEGLFTCVTNKYREDLDDHAGLGSGNVTWLGGFNAATGEITGGSEWGQWDSLEARGTVRTPLWFAACLKASIIAFALAGVTVPLEKFLPTFAPDEQAGYIPLAFELNKVIEALGLSDANSLRVDPQELIRTVTSMFYYFTRRSELQAWLPAAGEEF